MLPSLAMCAWQRVAEGRKHAMARQKHCNGTLRLGERCGAKHDALTPGDRVALHWIVFGPARVVNRKASRQHRVIEQRSCCVTRLKRRRVRECVLGVDRLHKERVQRGGEFHVRSIKGSAPTESNKPRVASRLAG